MPEVGSSPGCVWDAPTTPAVAPGAQSRSITMVVRRLGRPESYAPVAARIELFYERYPTGRILTELVQHTEQEIVFRAAVYRATEDREPAATGWAAERVGDGEVNAVACLENTETSAIGRAL